MTNPFLNNFDFAPEQKLLEDLIHEAIYTWGMEVYYLPRNINNFDQLYLTDDQSTYTAAIPCDVYLQDFTGFGGQQNIFTKFGLEIRDNITVVMSTREWTDKVQPTLSRAEIRPDEGDIIYFKLNHKAFQIKYTNNKELFYQLGYLPSYQLTCELFEYSDETFNTGIAEIDSIQNNESMNILDNVLTTENKTPITQEDGGYVTVEKYNQHNVDPGDDNILLDIQASGLIDYTELNPLGTVANSTNG